MKYILVFISFRISSSKSGICIRNVFWNQRNIKELSGKKLPKCSQSLIKLFYVANLYFAKYIFCRSSEESFQKFKKKKLLKNAKNFFFSKVPKYVTTRRKEFPKTSITWCKNVLYNIFYIKFAESKKSIWKNVKKTYWFGLFGQFSFTFNSII